MKTKAQHTSGDWIVEKGWNSSLPTITAKTSQTNLNERGLIADLTGTPFIEQAEANAHLMTASPKLLAALEGAIIPLERLIESSQGDVKKTVQERLRAARAAIAEALGTTNQE